MDPHVVFDCQRVLPNRFALTLAAAARKRALNRGAEPRLAPWSGAGNGDVALCELAAGAFSPEELSTALGPRATIFLKQPASTPTLPAAANAATAPRLLAQETIH